MDKEKNQTVTTIKANESQLCLNFDSKSCTNHSNLVVGKIVGINMIIEKQKSNLVKSIIRNTKSF